VQHRPLNAELKWQIFAAAEGLKMPASPARPTPLRMILLRALNFDPSARPSLDQIFEIDAVQA
jgi:hypothetical protein